MMEMPSCAACDVPAVDVLELGPNLTAPLCERHVDRWLLSWYRAAAIRRRYDTGSHMAATFFNLFVASERSDKPLDDEITVQPY
jgi:hypothetical protein